MDWHSMIGFIAATCTTFAFLPQAIKIIRTKHTRDLSLVMYSIFEVGLILWLIYGILITNYPIIFSNVITITFTTTILVLKIRYK